jgi:hypothetical protein
LQISGVSLTLTWPHRLCLFRVLLGTTATLASFPFSKHTGGSGAMPSFSVQLVYLQFTLEVPLSHFPVELSSQHHFYKLSHSKVAGWGPLLLPSLARWFICSSVRDAPPPFSAQGAPPPLPCVFCCCCLFSLFFSLFSLGGGQSVQGAMLIWPRVVYERTACHLAHLVVCVSRANSKWFWQRESPPGFSV